MCEHCSYCGLPIVHKEANYCKETCVLKNYAIEKLPLYSLVKQNCERLGIDRTESNNQILKIK